MKQGIVYWVTGLPGSGKTTLASFMQQQMQQQSTLPIMLDGDMMRDMLNCYDYTPDARLQLGYTYAKMAHMLAKQGHVVIVATVALFHEIHAWNRANMQNYIEIFLQTSLKDVKETRSFYTNDAKNVYGKDIQLQYPLKPHITLQGQNLQQHYQQIMAFTTSNY